MPESLSKGTTGDPFASIARKGPNGGDPFASIARKGPNGGPKSKSFEKRRSKASHLMPIARKG